MDALTPAGREALRHSDVALECLRRVTGCSFIQFKDKSPSRVDGVVIDSSGEVIGIYEVKSRDMTVEDLMGRFSGKWLVSYEKIIAGRELAMMLSVRFSGILHCVPSRKVLVQHIWSPKGDALTSFSVSQTETQATVNGGKIMRPNTYIDVRNARIHEVRS
jgi:hypothetical protein